MRKTLHSEEDKLQTLSFRAPRRGDRDRQCSVAAATKRLGSSASTAPAPPLAMTVWGPKTAEQPRQPRTPRDLIPTALPGGAGRGHHSGGSEFSHKPRALPPSSGVSM